MAANDQYEQYYSEKIWALIPEVYRDEDAEAMRPDVLRQLVEVVAEQAAVTRRSIDRLWEDQHIETCDDWAVPYIGDLVATRPLSDRDLRGRRVDVARTMHYRRRRGTPSVLETLVREISGWDVVLVEAFRRLIRTAHRLDAFPVPRGRVTGTPHAGTAHLRSPRNSDLIQTPFDELFHTPDVRLLRGQRGRLNIPKLNFHLYRLRAFPVASTPVQLQDPGPVTFTVDPSGRDIPMFSRGIPVSSDTLAQCGPPWTQLPPPDQRPNELAPCERRCLSRQEWEVARPMPCRLLTDAAFVISGEDVVLASADALPSEVEALERLIGLRFDNEARLRGRLTALGVDFSPEPVWYRDLLRRAVTADSAKPQLLPVTAVRTDTESQISVDIVLDSSSDEQIPFDQTTGADLSSRLAHPIPADLAIVLMVHPELGRFSYPQEQAPPPVVDDPDPKPDPEVEAFDDFAGGSDEVDNGPDAGGPEVEGPVLADSDETLPDPFVQPDFVVNPDLPTPETPLPTPDTSVEPDVPEPTPPPGTSCTTDSLALYARTGHLMLRDRVTARGPNGIGWAKVASSAVDVGGNETSCQVACEVGSMISRPSVTAADNLTVHGDLVTGGTLMLGNNPTIEGAVLVNTAVDLSDPEGDLDFTVSFAGGPSISVTNGMTDSRPPGTYSSVFVGGFDSKLKLSSAAGGNNIYFFQSLDVQAGAKLSIDASAGGTVYVFVQNSVTMSGRIMLEAGTTPENFVFVVMGTYAVFQCDDPFTGIAVAPNAAVTVYNEKTYVASFFGASLTLEAGQVFHHVPWDGTLPTNAAIDYPNDTSRLLRRASRGLVSRSGAAPRLVTQPTADSFEVSYQKPAAVASGEVALLSDVGVLTIAGGNVLSGAVVSLGTGSPATDLAAGSQVAEVHSLGDVLVQSGATVQGDVFSEGTVTNNGSILGSENSGASLALEPLLFNPPFDTVTFPTAGPDEMAVDGAVIDLPPGSYGSVTVDDAVLVLHAGTYHFVELHVQAGGQLRIDPSNDSAMTFVFVRNVLTWAGGLYFVWGSAAQLRLAYFGTAAVDLTTPFAGQFFAPQAALTLSSNAGQYAGQYFAASITLSGAAPVTSIAAAPLVHRYFYGFSGTVGAGGYPRDLALDPEASPATGGGGLPVLPESGPLTIDDSLTYRLVMAAASTITDTTLQAGDAERPYVLLENSMGPSAGELVPTAVAGGEDPDAAARRFAVEGVWLGSLDSSKTDWVVARATGTPATDFDWEEIVIRNSTLDPGGRRADGGEIAQLRLVVRGRVRRLVIEHSITGPILVDCESDPMGLVETLIVKNSIVDAVQPELRGDGTTARPLAISNPTGRVELEGVTVFGDLQAELLLATDSLVMGRLVVANTQQSCFRFSATSLADRPPPEVTDELAPRLPRLYEVPELDFIQPFFFTSRRFGHPGYAQLSQAAPEAVARGAESGSEMGAFSFLLQPITLGSIDAKVNEFKPIGVLPQFILEDVTTPAPSAAE